MFGWAFIGCGAIAETVACEIIASGRHRIVTAYSRTREKCERFSARFGAIPASDFVDAVTRDGVDGVYLATPHSCHYREIMECIRLGIPVLSEKAFTINAMQTEMIISADRHSYVSEGMWTRYNPITTEVKRLVESGAIGEIREARASFCYPYRFSNFSERVVKPEYGGGALLDIGVYPISYMNMLFGEPDTITSTMKIGKYGTDVHDSIDMTFGITHAHIEAGLDRLSTCGAHIIGTNGSIKMPLFYRPTRATILENGRKRTIRCKAGYLHEFDAVAGEIGASMLESSRIPLRDSLSVMRIMDSIRHEHSLIYPEDIESTNITK